MSMRSNATPGPSQPRARLEWSPSPEFDILETARRMADERMWFDDIEARSDSDDEEELPTLAETLERLKQTKRAVPLRNTTSGSVASVQMEGEGAGERDASQRREEPLFFPSEDEEDEDATLVQAQVERRRLENSRSPTRRPPIKREPTPIEAVPDYEMLEDDRRLLALGDRGNDQDLDDYDPFDDGRNDHLYPLHRDRKDNLYQHLGDAIEADKAERTKRMKGIQLGDPCDTEAVAKRQREATEKVGMSMRDMHARLPPTTMVRTGLITNQEGRERCTRNRINSGVVKRQWTSCHACDKAGTPERCLAKNRFSKCTECHKHNRKCNLRTVSEEEIHFDERRCVADVQRCVEQLAVRLESCPKEEQAAACITTLADVITTYNEMPRIRQCVNERIWNKINDVDMDEEAMLATVRVEVREQERERTPAVKAEPEEAPGSQNGKRRATGPAEGQPPAKRPQI